MKNPLEYQPNDLAEIQSQLLKKLSSLNKSNEWITFPEQNNIKSWISHPNDGKVSIVKAQSKINCSAQQLYDYLVTNIDSTCSEWNDVMYYSGSIKKFNDHFEISRVISEGHVVADREDVFLRCSGKLEGDIIYEVAKGFSPDEIPVDKSHTKYIVRTNMYFTSKEIQPINDHQCMYTAIWQDDPMGWLSKLMPQKMMGKILLKNLVHEHKKLQRIFK